MKYLYLLMMLTSILFPCHAQTDGNARIKDEVNWESFLSRHDLVWEKTPDDYFNAPFLGNGLLGAMLYAPKGEKLRLDIGRTDVVEHRQTNANSVVDNGRLPVGYFTLEMNDFLKTASGRLDLYNAEAGFEFLTQNSRQFNLKALVFKEHDAIMVEYNQPVGMQMHWAFHPVASMVPLNQKVGTRYLNPAPEWGEIEGISTCTQKRDAGGSYTTAWKQIKTGSNSFRLLITIQDSYPGEESSKNAVAVIQRLLDDGEVEEQISAHRKWWNTFYTASFISIPHPRMESVYWIQQYKFASMMRKDGPLCDLMGPWYKHTVWPGIWWNLNTQMLYSSLHISNQTELASTLPDYLIKMHDQLVAAVPEKWRYNSAGVSRQTGPAMEESILTYPSPESPERSNLTYLCYYLWEFYRTTMDEAYLRNHLFPLLKRSVNLMLHEITTDENGVIHTPHGHCPESSDDADNNYDLSSLMWGCRTLLRINNDFNLRDPRAKEWQNVVDNLIPFPVDENGYRSSVDIPAPLMHRHWSHLLMIYPYYLVNWEQPGSRENIRNSLHYWGSPEIPNTWTQCVISSMYSSARNGEKALEHMNLALASPNFHPNTFHAEGRNRNPCSETYGGLCRMLQDMLIQSWGDIIRIFPAIAEDWQNAIFHNLRAEGGFEVSAKREKGNTVWVRIRNNAGESCIIEPGFEDKFSVKGGKLKKLEEGIYKLNIKKGEEAILVADIQEKIGVIAPVKATSGEYNFYGIKEFFK